MRLFRALSGVTIATHLDLEHLQRSPVTGPEQIVQDVCALWLRVIEEEARPTAATADATHAVEALADTRRVEDDGNGRPSRSGEQEEDAEGQDHRDAHTQRPRAHSDR